jgi:hypothetical protein
MAYTEVFQPTPITEQHSTCATCPLFHDYQDSRERGLCQAFDKVTRKHHLLTADCTSAIQAPKQQSISCTVKVQLITEAVEDDGYGYAVPVDECIIDVVVAHPSMELVEAEIAHREDLSGYRIVDFWQPEDYFEL